jgi:hypothetical protein
MNYRHYTAAGLIAVAAATLWLTHAQMGGDGGGAGSEVSPSLPVEATCALSANPARLTTGQSAVLSWATSNATNAAIDHAIGPVSPLATGSVFPEPVVTTTYAMTVSGPRGSATCAATITVVAEIADQVWDLARHPENILEVTRWRSVAEHIYTSDDTAPAASPFVGEGTVFAVSAAKQDGMIPLYRLHKRTHLYTASDPERAHALGDGYADDGIVGYLFVQPSPGLVPLHAWFNPKTNLRFLSLDEGESAAIESQGFAAEGVIGHVFARRVPQRIGAYYYDLFSPQGYANIKNNISGVYGASALDGAFWWIGVRSLYEHNLTPVMLNAAPGSEAFFLQDNSFRKPVIGYYDQSDPKVLEQQINQAISNGVSYFAFYWYWDFQRGAEILNDGLDSLLAARNSNLIDFSIAICEEGNQFTLMHSDFQKVAALVTRKYFSRPNYLHTRDGRLIVEICDASGIRTSADPIHVRHYTDVDAPAVTAFVNDLRTQAKSALGKDLFVVARTDWIPDAVRSLTVLDGYTCIAPRPDSSSIAANYQASLAWMSTQPQPFMPCLSERTDQRPQVGIILSVPNIFYYPTDVTPAVFKTGLAKTRQWMDAHRDNEISQFLTIYAWNEWYEGGTIEPNVRDGASILNQIPAAFDVPYIPLRCRTTGRCPTAAGVIPPIPGDAEASTTGIRP